LDTETATGVLCATEPQQLNLNPLTWTSPCEDWSLTSLKEKLIKIGAKVVSHFRFSNRPFRVK
jgi:hypothetical protein